ncbi:MAG: hypothetical protein F6K19_01640 [Cyanothece sp. SIO1E1]|nr:hypothetical protein [Cyanothece sp. SIO1E1]
MSETTEVVTQEEVATQKEVKINLPIVALKELQKEVKRNKETVENYVPVTVENFEDADNFRKNLKNKKLDIKDKWQKVKGVYDEAMEVDVKPLHDLFKEAEKIEKDMQEKTDPIKDEIAAEKKRKKERAEKSRSYISDMQMGWNEKINAKSNDLEGLRSLLQEVLGFEPDMEILQEDQKEQFEQMKDRILVVLTNRIEYTEKQQVMIEQTRRNNAEFNLRNSISNWKNEVSELLLGDDLEAVVAKIDAVPLDVENFDWYATEIETAKKTFREQYKKAEKRIKDQEEQEFNNEKIALESKLNSESMGIMQKAKAASSLKDISSLSELINKLGEDYNWQKYGLSHKKEEVFENVYSDIQANQKRIEDEIYDQELKKLTLSFKESVNSMKLGLKDIDTKSGLEVMDKAYTNIKNTVPLKFAKDLEDVIKEYDKSFKKEYNKRLTVIEKELSKKAEDVLVDADELKSFLAQFMDVTDPLEPSNLLTEEMNNFYEVFNKDIDDSITKLRESIEGINKEYGLVQD